MPNIRNRARRNRSRGGGQGRNIALLHADNRNIQELLANQLTSSVPDTKDIEYPRIKRNTIHTWQQSYVGPVIQGSATLEVDGVITVALSSFPNGASLAAVYDTYRIIAVKVVFVPVSPLETGNLSAPIYTVLDYDDSTAVAITGLVQYDTLKVSPPDTFFERTFTPAIAVAVYSGAFTSFGQRRLQWLDCSSDGVVHYGLKYAVPSSGNAPNWQTSVHAIIQFKNSR